MSEHSLNDVLSRLITEAERAASQQQQPPTSHGLAEPVQAVGTSPDEQITITVTDGRVTACDLRPQALRQTNVELSDQLIGAMNAALEGYQTAVMAALSQERPDLSPMAGNLREIQADASRMVKAYTDQMHEMLRRVNQP